MKKSINEIKNDVLEYSGEISISDTATSNEYDTSNLVVADIVRPILFVNANSEGIYWEKKEGKFILENVNGSYFLYRDIFSGKYCYVFDFGRSSNLSEYYIINIQNYDSYFSSVSLNNNNYLDVSEIDRTISTLKKVREIVKKNR